MSAQAKGDGGATADSVANEIDPTLNGPAVAYLCSDEGNWVHGQLLGTGNNRLVMVEHLKYGTGIFVEPGKHFTVEMIQAQFQGSLGSHLEPYGLWKNPYPHIDKPVVPKS